jgi:hypothetical protein
MIISSGFMVLLRVAALAPEPVNVYINRVNRSSRQGTSAVVNLIIYPKGFAPKEKDVWLARC